MGRQFRVRSVYSKEAAIKKSRKFKRKKHKLKRYPNRNHHHLVPASLGGSNHRSNLLLIDIEKHYHWHRIFGNKDLEQVIQLLTRLQELKAEQR